MKIIVTLGNYFGLYLRLTSSAIIMVGFVVEDHIYYGALLKNVNNIIRSRLDRSVELYAIAFREDDEERGPDTYYTHMRQLSQENLGWRKRLYCKSSNYSATLM